MSRKQLRRRKAAVLVLLVAFVSAIALMLLPSSAGEAQKITDPKPKRVKYVPPAKPKLPIGPIKRTTAVVSDVRVGTYLVANLSEQRLYEMLDGQVVGKPVKISSGTVGHATPTGTFTISRRINGWHESTLYPGGMMYKPMYLVGAVAIHGTPESNYGLLGQRASHGCIRVHQKVADHLSKHYPNGTKVIIQA